MPNNKAKVSPARILYREGQCYDSMAQRDGHTTKILPHVRHRYNLDLVLLSLYKTIELFQDKNPCQKVFTSTFLIQQY